MPDREPVDPWLEPLVESVTRHGRQGGFIIDLGEYRPDLARYIAHVIDVSFFDYRAEVMSVLGWAAHTVTLGELTETLMDRALAGGTVVFNIEALLATKADASRSRWLGAFLETAFPHAIILPLGIYGAVVDPAHPRLCKVPTDRLPPQSLLNRLAL
jgi:hypothetical protein